MPTLSLLCRLSLLVLVLATRVEPALAAPTTIDISAEASRSAVNDLARATVFAEATGATPGELSKRINSLITEGLKTAKGYANVKTPERRYAELSGLWQGRQDRHLAHALRPDAGVE